ncbi:MAG: ribonuclease P protein component [Patescibacteria group bacterium]
MFSDKHRLRHDQDIARVLKSKKSVFDAAAGLKYAVNEKAHNRVTVVVGIKVSKNATDRNRVKRQYREIVRLLMPDLKTGFDIIILVSKPALALDYEQKRTRLTQVFKKSGLLQASARS